MQIIAKSPEHQLPSVLRSYYSSPLFSLPCFPSLLPSLPSPRFSHFFPLQINRSADPATHTKSTQPPLQDNFQDTQPSPQGRAKHWHLDDSQRISIEFGMEEDLRSAVLVGDITRLRQVLCNLVSEHAHEHAQYTHTHTHAYLIFPSPLSPLPPFTLTGEQCIQVHTFTRGSVRTRKEAAQQPL